jgi:hypothetical protein
MRGIDPKWTMYLGLLVAIEQAIGHGTVSLTNLVPADWAPYITSWCNFLAFVGTSIMTYQAAVSSPTAGPAINTPIAPTSTVVKILLVAFALSAFLATGSAQAQGIKLRPPTGDLVKDIQAATSPAPKLITGNVEKDAHAIWDKLVSASQADLKYASALAASANTPASAVRKQCYDAIITLNTQVNGMNVKDANGVAVPQPDPKLFTGVEQAAETIDNLSPSGPLFTNCAGMAQLMKTNVLTLVNAIVTGAAGFAAMPIIPGL